jgi:putative membrane-bound dehydrogenase-like protein
VLCASAGVLAAEPAVSEREMPRFPAVEAREAHKTFRVRPGFRVELAASEPNVQSPVAMAWDEDERLYVVEMRDYSERREEKLGRVRLLEDADGDGVYERAGVFAEGLAWPTAVFPWKGGVFVGCTPDVLYLRDTDGDGRADERRVVFTGFGEGVKRLNVQALLNSFNWGLDNRVHGAASMNGGRVRRSDGATERRSDGGKADAGVELRGKGFAFDPVSLELAAEDGGGQHGLSFDDWGRKYVCSNSHHIQAFAYEGRYAGLGGKEFVMPPGLVDIAADGPAAEVYRASPEEPWRVIRTKWRVSGAVPGIIEGGGRSAGYFTGATGVTIYRGDAYGAAFAGDAFIGDAGGNLVHRKRIRPSGVLVRAERPADERKSEFLASTDTWFRPVQFANGPDGCLHAIDMYRETIEHPWSLPEGLKKHLDLNSGWDRGRIWRVVPEKFERRPRVKLSKATAGELVGLLSHPNGWHRDTAARLIYERQDRGVVRMLEAAVLAPAKPQAAAAGRVHALYALLGLGALGEAHVMAALGDADERVRAHGVRLSETLARPTDALKEKLDALVEDPALAVRYQLAFTLGTRPDDHLPRRLATIYAKDAGDPWVEAAVLNAVGARAIELLRLLDSPPWRGTAAAARLSPRLAEIVGARGYGEEIASAIEIAGSQQDALAMMTTARGLGAGLRRNNLPIEAEKGAALLDRAAEVAADAKADAAARVAAAGVLGYGAWSHAAEVLVPLLDPRQGQDVQAAALASLDLLDEGELAGEVLKRWAGMSPRLREAAVGVMVKRPTRAVALLEAIRDGKVRRGDVSGSQAAALRQSANEPVKELAAKVLAAPAGKRDDVVKAFTAAVDTKGDAKRGREVYLAKCASCHRFKGEGTALGPDLEAVQNAGREKLLVNVLDPNREVAPNFTAYVVETADGDSHVGVVAAETAAAVTLRMAAGAEVVVPRGEIKSMRSAGLSMMPEGLEEGMTVQDVADLLEYVAGGR